MYKRDAGEMQACTATRTWQGLELPNELPPKPEEKKRGGDQGCMHNTKAQQSKAKQRKAKLSNAKQRKAKHSKAKHCKAQLWGNM